MPFRWRDWTRFCVLVLLTSGLTCGASWCTLRASADNLCLPHASGLLLAQLPAGQGTEGPRETLSVGAPVGPDANPRLRPQAGGMILRPEDVLSISVQGEPQLSGQVQVRPDGLIVLPLLGEVQASGMTVTELADFLREELRRYVVNPIVSVIQVGGVPRVVSVLGAVGAPGTYDVRQYESLLAVLAACGGPSPEADLARAVLVRDGEPARVVKDVVPGEPIIPMDIQLQAGDALIVPSLTQRAVRVAGAVVRPGLVMLEEGLTASRALLWAGGADESADLTAVQVLRGANRINLNLRPILRAEMAAEGEMARDEELQLDDIVLVPRASGQAIFVIGAVNTPGPLPPTETQTASKAVVMAGGPGPSADLSAAYVLRDGEMVALELTPLLQPAQAAPDAVVADAQIEPGDVVVVPELQPIFAVGGLNTPGAVSPAQAGSVSDLVVLAGGLADDADGAGAYVLRDGEQIPVDLAALFDDGDASVDMALQPRDALVVPRQPQVFHVVGQVMSPGTYPLEQAPTVLDAWALSGGPLLMADSAHALLLRGGETEELNLEGLVHRGDMSQNRDLRAGDTLLVPRIEDEVYVFGVVARPGVHPIREGDTVIDILADAGGPGSGANIKKIALIRRRVVEAERREGLYERPAEDARPSSRPRVTRSSRPTRPGIGSRYERPGRDEPARDSGAQQADRVEQVAQKLAEGTQAVALFDLAKVPDGDPRFLVQPGDVIYVPAKQVERNEFRQIILQIVSSLIAGALL